MVRGPAALLAALVLGQLYVSLAGDVLPAPAAASDAALVAGAVGLAVLVVVLSAVVAVGDEPVLLGLAGLGAWLLAAGLDAGDVAAGATLAELIAWGALGAVFAIVTQTPALVLVLPVFVALVDVGTTLGSGGQAAGLLLGGDPAGDLLSLAVPGWDGRPPPAALGVTDAVFLGVFLTYARRFGLKPWAVTIASAAWLVAVFALELRQDVVVPAVPVLAAVLFAVNLDRLRPVFRAARSG